MLAVVVALLLQSPAPAPPAQLPVSLDRVRQGLSRPPRFEFPPRSPWGRVFRVNIEVWKPFEDTIWAEATADGWVRASAPQQHVDFLQSVTPQEVRSATAYPCCNVTPVVQSVTGFVRGRVRATKESRAKREVAEAMRAAGITRR